MSKHNTPSTGHLRRQNKAPFSYGCVVGFCINSINLSWPPAQSMHSCFPSLAPAAPCLREAPALQQGYPSSHCRLVAGVLPPCFCRCRVLTEAAAAQVAAPRTSPASHLTYTCLKGVRFFSTLRSSLAALFSSREKVGFPRLISSYIWKLCY